jgi:SAM-dependent methyltransferase
MSNVLPSWADSIVELVNGNDVQEGILRCNLTNGDSGIDYYRSIDGAHMHERAAVKYAMSSLDTPVYREYLSRIRPPSLDALIVDVGGGDGRNAEPWLEWGYRRVVVVDPVFSALRRFRSRLADRPEWLDRLLLIEADARRLPLIAECASRVQAIESLFYLNESYEDGLRECMRLLSGTGQILVSERDYEGGLITSLLYGGVSDCLAQAGTRDVWDGIAGLRVRSRCFTIAELVTVLERNQLSILSNNGLSALSLLLGYLRSAGKITSEDELRIDDVYKLLLDLGNTGSIRRCHVVVAEKHA